MSVVSAEDYRDIQLLLSGAAVAIDVDDYDAYLASFCRDGVFQVFGREFMNGERLRLMIETAPKGLHLAGVPHVELHGHEIRSRQNFLFVNRETLEQRTGLYSDVIAREAGVWKIKVRRCEFYRPAGLSDRPEG